ncbi:MAG: thiamine phosphate synthase [Nitrospirota bacterium]
MKPSPPTRNSSPIKGLYIITDARFGLGHIEMAERVLRAGVRIIQFREKDLCRKEMFETVLMLRNVSRIYKAILIINDHVDIAAAVDADGVHLGQDDLSIDVSRRILGSDKIIGISTHNLAEALEAQRAGADYIGLGAMFPSDTKKEAKVCGIEMLRTIRPHITIPIVAIGGITPENVTEIVKAGADAVAVASAVSLPKNSLENTIHIFMEAFSTPR